VVVGFQVHHVHVRAPPVDVAALRPVDQPVDDPRVGLLGFVLLVVEREVSAGLAVLGGGLLDERDPASVGRPRGTSHAADHVGHLPGLAAVGRDDPELGSVVVRTAGADEREPVTARAPPRGAVDALRDGELPGLVAADGDHVDGRLVLVVAVGDLPDERDPLPVGRDTGLAHLNDVVIIARTDRFHTSPL